VGTRRQADHRALRVRKRRCETHDVTSHRDSAERHAASMLDLARSGGRDARIEIVEYDPSWPERFVAETTRLAEILPAVELHHIGSTAVPGLAAKPIIDMMALVADLDTPLPALVHRAGYQYPQAYNATLSGCRWLCRPSASHRTHHLHLVADPAELARHLRFRDALRENPQLASEYAALKYDLAERMADDREGYTAAKTAFVRRTEAGF
jgi:GrpB-like predicted nucleotidyltransferase (UPF0157 family)